MDNDARHTALERLHPFIGTWRVDAVFPHVANADVAHPVIGSGEVVFEWTLGGKFLVGRAVGPSPAPDSLVIISPNTDGATYSEHYFDSRGVVRMYAMTLDDRRWALQRSSPDFSPLDFEQRFTATFNDACDSITGRWEKCESGTGWEHDFDLTYTKVA